MEKAVDEKLECFKGLSSRFSGPLLPSLFISLPSNLLSPRFRRARQIVFTTTTTFVLVDGGISSTAYQCCQKKEVDFRKEKENKQPVPVKNRDSLPKLPPHDFRVCEITTTKFAKKNTKSEWKKCSDNSYDFSGSIINARKREGWTPRWNRHHSSMFSSLLPSTPSTSVLPSPFAPSLPQAQWIRGF